MRIGRTVPPVGVRIPVRDIVGAIFDAVSTPGSLVEAFLHDVEDYFQVRRAFGVSSGKSALTVILNALKALSPRRRVVLPAYTCYSVPSAIVRAGLDPAPCDVDAATFDYDFAQLQAMLDEGVLCVLSVHLFGIPSNTERLRRICSARGIFVIEDAAQAMGGSVDGRRLGGFGDASFFSLGRGKNITCGSGGIVMSNSEMIGAEIAKITQDLPADGLERDIQALVALLALDALISPWLYWIPSGIPFLRLGETIFDTRFPIRRLTNYKAAILRRWRDRLGVLAETRRANARYYIENVPGARAYGVDLPYLRFPVVLDARAKRRVLAGRNVSQLGISGMYPASVDRIPELGGRFEERAFPVAGQLAESLVTLPTHPLVSESDRNRICAAISRARSDS